ncbi:MAG: hypothetical protein JXR83_11100, partial [Deltaproteobacteria bacterium]|nr:hypothetical protein [Deltaproteobacteria bacterium]
MVGRRPQGRSGSVPTWPAAMIGAALATGCQHAPPKAPSAGLRQELAAAAVDWDDPRLQAVAEALQASGRPLAELQAAAAQQMAGRGAPTSQLVLARQDDPDLALEIGLLAPARCALAGPAPALVLCSRALIDFQNAPVALASGELLLVSGRALRQVRVVEVLVLDCSGRLSALAVDRRGRAFSATAAAPLAGPAIVEVMVESERGREVAALWQVTAGQGATPDAACPATRPASVEIAIAAAGGDPADPAAT